MHEVSSEPRRRPAILVVLLLAAGLCGCDAQDIVLPNVEAGGGSFVTGSGALGGSAASPGGTGGVGAGGLTPGGGGALPAGGAGLGGSGGSGSGGAGGVGGGTALEPDCDLNGFWAVREYSVAEALGLEQCASAYYLMELRQEGATVEVASHLNCGTEARGSANATFNQATRRALLQSNSQLGRTGTITKVGGQCQFTMEPFWALLGVDEASYAPASRFSAEPLSAVKGAIPMPQDAAGAIDFEGDGKPGIAFQISVAINGIRHAVVRSVGSWTTNDRYAITPALDWPDDLNLRFAYYGEEYAVATEPEGDALLTAGSNIVPNSPAARVTMRFLGRTLADPRAAAVVVGGARADNPDGALQTCKAIAEALPPIPPLGFPQVCPCIGGGVCQ